MSNPYRDPVQLHRDVLAGQRRARRRPDGLLLLIVVLALLDLALMLWLLSGGA